MAKINVHIEIVSATKPELSSMGQKSREGAREALAPHFKKVGISTVNNLLDLEALVARKPDLVFLGMKFIPTNHQLGVNDPDKIWITDYLDKHDIEYTGSGQSAHELELAKHLAKRRVREAGLKTASFHVAFQNQSLVAEDLHLNFPLFIKPTSSGGGLGVDSASVAHNFEQAHSKTFSIANTLQSDSLIEEYLPGREFSVAVLRNRHTTEYTVMPLELIAPADRYGARLLSATVKSADTEESIPVTDKILKAKLSELAIGVFRVLGARDYGRIDIRLDKSGVPHFLEANLIPSLLDGYGNFPKACRLNQDMDYESMLLEIVHLALSRREQPYEALPGAAGVVMAELLPA